MKNRLPSLAVFAMALVPVLACGQSGTPAQGAINQALGGIATGVAAQAWSGTLRITQTAQHTSSQDTVIHHSTTVQTASNTVVITLTSGIASAAISFEQRDGTDMTDKYEGYTLIGTIKEVTTGVGTNKSDAEAKVSLYDDGSYEIEFNSGGVTGQYTKVQTTQTICGSDPSCRPTSASTTKESANPTKIGFISSSVRGTINKAQPNVLSGSATEPFDIFSSQTPGQTTIAWNLKR